jgi:hypothetical protein
MVTVMWRCDINRDNAQQQQQQQQQTDNDNDNDREEEDGRWLRRGHTSLTHDEGWDNLKGDEGVAGMCFYIPF